MELKYDYWTGHFEDIKASLIKSISQHSINHKGIRIGITNDPERRHKEYQIGNQGWVKMIVKYETTSANYIHIMDEILSSYHWEYASNIKGDVSESYKTPPFYVYLVIK